MKSLKAGALIVAALFAGTVSACPPGSVMQKGNGWEGCVQSTSSDDSGPVWKRQWGAIATDGANSALGTAADIDSKRSAEKIALRMCEQEGGRNCKIKIAYYNQCASVISGYSMIFVQSAETREEATSDGMKRCVDSGDDGCREFYSGCSLPKRVR